MKICHSTEGIDGRCLLGLRNEKAANIPTAQPTEAAIPGQFITIAAKTRAVTAKSAHRLPRVHNTWVLCDGAISTPIIRANAAASPLLPNSMMLSAIHPLPKDGPRYLCTTPKNSHASQNVRTESGKTPIQRRAISAVFFMGLSIKEGNA